MADKSDVWRTIGTATRVMNTEIRKEIIRQDAIDTGRMRNVSKIVNLKWDDAKDDISLEIKSTFYYKFVDERKAKKWKNGKVNRNITKAFMKREKVLNHIEKVIAKIFEYRVDEQFK
jgi:hypothetical protein